MASLHRMNRRDTRADPEVQGWRRYLGVFRYTSRAMDLVWQTDRRLLGLLLFLTLLAGLLPAGIAQAGRLIVDGVVHAAETQLPAHRTAALWFIALELGLVAAMAGIQRGLDASQSLLRVKLGHRVNVMILDKALQLDLVHFEDSELYDKLTRARREASSRPLSLVRRSLGLAQNGLSLATYGAILVGFSPWAVGVLVLAALPAFVAETRFAGQAFRLFSWRAPETREQAYLEVVVAREDYPSLLLEDYFSAEINSWDNFFKGMSSNLSFPLQKAFPYWLHDSGSFPVFHWKLELGDNIIKNYRLTAYGGDYTITNLVVEPSENADFPEITGKIVGLTNGQVIEEGETVEFSLIMNLSGNIDNSGNGTDNIVEGLSYQFDVAEKPGWSFEYRPHVY